MCVNPAAGKWKHKDQEIQESKGQSGLLEALQVRKGGREEGGKDGEEEKEKKRGGEIRKKGEKEKGERMKKRTKERKTRKRKRFSQL